MDYCHPCQRHLNGALACAGCGTPADALAPYAVPARSVHEPEPPGEILEPSGRGGSRRRARGAAGRKGGRRVHRRRGRGLLLTAVGVVLAAGALSLAELAVEPEHEDGAAEYVSEATATVTEPVPPPSAGTVHDGPGPVDVPTAVPVTDSHSADAGPATSAAPEDSGAPESASAPPEEPPSASTPSDPTNPSDPPDTGTPADPTPSGRPTADPTRPEPPEEPSPSPSPTETCTRWLWFCT